HIPLPEFKLEAPKTLPELIYRAISDWNNNKIKIVELKNMLFKHISNSVEDRTKIENILTHKTKALKEKIDAFEKSFTTMNSAIKELDTHNLAELEKQKNL